MGSILGDLRIYASDSAAMLGDGFDGLELAMLPPFAAVTGVFIYLRKGWDAPCVIGVELVDDVDEGASGRRFGVHWNQYGPADFIELPGDERDALFPPAFDPPFATTHVPGFWQYVWERRLRVVARMLIPEGGSAPTQGKLALFLEVAYVARLLP